ncbi:hypothetical protein GF336_04780 [Candidatus Woesearchaeota archaeon]|nr:hypothetical protein [Candidatus Woesearchaeota archaeon]
MIENIINILLLAKDILIGPFIDSSILWIVLPLILILILIDLYFGRHRSEELGWNSAFSNSISMLWICIIIFRFLFQEYGFEITLSPIAVKEFAIAGILALWVIVILTLNFFHIVPKKFAFIISSSKSVYITAFIIISVIFGDFALDSITLIASVILLLILLVFLNAVKCLIPMTNGAKQAVKRKENKKKKSKAGKKAAQTKKAKKAKKRIKKTLRNARKKLEEK